MSVISLFSISKSYGGRAIFKDVNFAIMKGKKVALFGNNGSGKSTLFKIITGVEEKDSGNIVISNDTKIGYLEQILLEDCSIFQFMLNEKKRALELEKLIETTTDPLKLTKYYEEFEIAGYSSFRSEVREVLTAFEFSRDVWDKNINFLSGGELERLKLARVIVSDCNLLLLDEPTNYLDIIMIDWLESFLKKTDKTVIFITHDRRLLENVADEILFINNCRIDHFRMGFNRFLNVYKDKEDRLKVKKTELEEEKRGLQDFVNRHRAGIKSKQVNARIKMIKEIDEELENLSFEDRDIDFYFKKGREEGFEVVSFENVVLGYEDNILTKPFSFKIYKGEKVGFIGKNGSGKSSLLKGIVGVKNGIKEGDIRIGSRVDIGYFDQILKSDSEKTLLEDLLEIDVEVRLQEIYNLIPKFGFKFDDLDKSLKILSGGELAKVSLMKIFLKKPNLLVLDEPTNHLDYETVEILKRALMEYNGTIVMVSHDRYFMEGLIDKYIFFYNGVISLENSLPQIINVDNNIDKDKKREKSKVKKVDRYKVSKVKSEILELEDLLNLLYLERENNLTDWQKLEECNKKIDELEYELLLKYEELDRMTKEDI